MTIAFDNSYARLGEPFSYPQEPQHVKAPALIRLNEGLAVQLGLDVDWLAGASGLQALSGNGIPDGATPIATAYAGHQFGQFNPQLGDGRAILLGEVVDVAGHRYDLQLKGSGRTPWSRGGDGRSPLGPVLREYVVSEAMHTLGVPTTRALAAVSTGEQVVREYLEPGAILTRVASSHLRVGTMQYFAAREARDALRELVDYTLARHYGAADERGPALALLDSVIATQAALVARWQLLGFIHGVMNTDNMLLSGETVDYGPCAFMEAYNPDTVFSSIDQQGRYAYCNQPGIAHWNLARLAESLLPLIDDDADHAVAAATTSIQRFSTLFAQAYSQGLAIKLGLEEWEDEADAALADDLFAALAADKADFTLAFRFLAEELDPAGVGARVDAIFTPGQKLLEWLPRWKQRALRESGDIGDRQRRMLAANPAFIARNHLIQQAIEAGEEGNFDRFHRLVERLANPADYTSTDEDLARPALPQEQVLKTFCGT